MTSGRCLKRWRTLSSIFVVFTAPPENVIGSDLNVSLAPSLEGLTDSRVHSNANGAPSRWRVAVTEWIHSLRFRALCTVDHASLSHMSNGIMIPIGRTRVACFSCVSEHVQGEAGVTVIIGRLMALFVWIARSCGVRYITTSSRMVDGHPKLMRRNKIS